MSDGRRKIADLRNRDRFTNGHRFDKHLSGAENRFVGTTDHDVPLEAPRDRNMDLCGARSHSFNVEPIRRNRGAATMVLPPVNSRKTQGYDVLGGGPRKSRSVAAAMYPKSEKPA
jgi:hypothetical protein